MSHLAPASAPLTIAEIREAWRLRQEAVKLENLRALPAAIAAFDLLFAETFAKAVAHQAGMWGHIIENMGQTWELDGQESLLNSMAIVAGFHSLADARRVLAACPPAEPAFVETQEGLPHEANDYLVGWWVIDDEGLHFVQSVAGYAPTAGWLDHADRITHWRALPAHPAG